MPDPPLLRISLSLRPSLHHSLRPQWPGPGQRCDHCPHPALHRSSRLLTRCWHRLLARSLQALPACHLLRGSWTSLLIQPRPGPAPCLSRLRVGSELSPLPTPVLYPLVCLRMPSPSQTPRRRGLSCLLPHDRGRGLLLPPACDHSAC